MSVYRCDVNVCVIVCVWVWVRGSFPDGLEVKNLPAGDSGLIPWSGRSPGGGHGNPLWYSCLETPIDRGAWWATVHGVAESDMSEVTEHAGMFVTVCVCDVWVWVYVAAGMTVAAGSKMARSWARQKIQGDEALAASPILTQMIVLSFYSWGAEETRWVLWGLNYSFSHHSRMKRPNSFLWSLGFSLNGGGRLEGGLGNDFPCVFLPGPGARASPLCYLASGELFASVKLFVIFWLASSSCTSRSEVSSISQMG